MTQKPNDTINQSTEAYDFSQECPAFREQLFAEFLKQAGSEWAVPLEDDELSMLNAAGGPPTNNNEHSSRLTDLNDPTGFAKRKKEEL